MAKTNISDKEARNQLNYVMRQEPWYQEWFEQRGLNPNQVQLSKQQKAELQVLVVSKGFLDASDGHIDEAGNVSDFHGWKGLPTAAKMAIIGGATVATAGAMGAFSGGAGAVSGSSTAAGMSGMGVAPSLAGSTAAGAGSMAGGASTLSGVGAITAGGGVGLSTIGKVGNMLRAGTGAVGAATESAANKQANDAQFGLQANSQNIQGENAFQNQQMSMAELEARQQEAARKNLYRASVMKNPQVSVENKQGAPKFSSEMLEGMTSLEKQALSRLNEEAQYTTGQMRKPRDYQPYDAQAATQPSTMQTVGNWLAPGMSIAQLGLDLF